MLRGYEVKCTHLLVRYLVSVIGSLRNPLAMLLKALHET